MHNYYINKLLDLKEVKVKKIVHGNSIVKIYIETKATPQICPCCGQTTKCVHDYRYQSIKDLPLQLKHCYLILRKRRYRCSCGKRFFEKYSFLARYQQRTTRLTKYIVNELRNTVSLKAVAQKANVSIPTVSRILDTVHYTCPSLKDTIAIDEFKGVPDRSQSHLSAYFREINRSERHRVKYFICDMWQPYVDLADAYFPNAQVIIDKYHFIRQVTWAIEKVRKRLQKTMPASLRKYYKRSRKLILL